MDFVEPLLVVEYHSDPGVPGIKSWDDEIWDGGISGAFDSQCGI